jgi:hypothetical protein
MNGLEKVVCEGKKAGKPLRTKNARLRVVSERSKIRHFFDSFPFFATPAGAAGVRRA